MTFTSTSGRDTARARTRHITVQHCARAHAAYHRPALRARARRITVQPYARGWDARPIAAAIGCIRAQGVSDLNQERSARFAHERDVELLRTLAVDRRRSARGWLISLRRRTTCSIVRRRSRTRRSLAILNVFAADSGRADRLL
jgi:hypothetical protein